MASSSASVPARKGAKPSKNFLSELFETRLFTDTTIIFGNGHVFKVHKDILIEKSKWFAANLADKTELQVDVPAAIKPQIRLHWNKECAITHSSVDETCNGNDNRVSKLFHEFLRYCYTGEYHDTPQSSSIGTVHLENNKFARCKTHVSMYHLADHFGVEDLINHSSQRYHDIALAIEPSHLSLLRLVFNLIYKDDTIPKGDSPIHRAATNLCLEHGVRLIRERAGADGLNLLRKRLRETCTKCGKDFKENAEICSDCALTFKKPKKPKTANASVST